MNVLRITIAVVMVLSCVGSGSGAVFYGLGDLPGGINHSDARDISADGRVVVGLSESANGKEAFRWEAGVMEGLGDLPEGRFESEAAAVSDNGSVVVGQGVSENGWEAFRWENGVMEGLGDIPTGPFHSFSHDVSGDGSIVVGRGQDEGGADAFIWENGTMTPMFIQEETMSSSATSISSDGSIIVGGVTFVADPFPSWDFRYENGNMSLVGSDVIDVLGISGDGSVIYGAFINASNNYEAARYENGVVTGLGDLPGGEFHGFAKSASHNGSVIVGGSSSDGSIIVGGVTFSVARWEAFLWTSGGGMVNLRDYLVDHGAPNAADLVLSYASGVSADGNVIVGRGYDPDRQMEGWIAFLVYADFDEDWDVDGDDFLIWQSGFGTANGATLNDGDADGDGDVDGDDFLIWQNQFGSGNGSASAAVPEPTSTMLLTVALIGAVFGKRRY